MTVHIWAILALAVLLGGIAALRHGNHEALRRLANTIGKPDLKSLTPKEPRC